MKVIRRTRTLDYYDNRPDPKPPVDWWDVFGKGIRSAVFVIRVTIILVAMMIVATWVTFHLVHWLVQWMNG